MVSSHQGELLGEKDTDCGSKRYLEITVTPSNGKDLEYRYFLENGKLKLLTPEIMSKYYGKTLKFRSVMYCKTVGKEKCICNVCAGDFYYKMGKKNIGLICKSPASQLTQLSLQKFHQNLIKSHKVDVNDLLI